MHSLFFFSSRPPPVPYFLFAFFIFYLHSLLFICIPYFLFAFLIFYLHPLFFICIPYFVFAPLIFFSRRPPVQIKNKDPYFILVSLIFSLHPLFFLCIPYFFLVPGRPGPGGRDPTPFFCIPGFLFNLTRCRNCRGNRVLFKS